MVLAFGYKYLHFAWDSDLLALAVFAVLGWFLFKGAADEKK